MSAPRPRRVPRAEPAGAPRPCPRRAAGAGCRARRAARASGRGHCGDREASAGRGEMWGRGQDTGGQGQHTGQGTGHWGTGTWGAHGAGNGTLGMTTGGAHGAGDRTPGDRDMGSTWGREQSARGKQGRGTGCQGSGTRTPGDPWGCGRRGGVAPRLPTHLNRTEILFSVAAMLYTSSSSRDEAWAGPRVGDTPRGVGDTPHGAGDSRQAGDTLLPAVPCCPPHSIASRPALPHRYPIPARATTVLTGPCPCPVPSPVQAPGSHPGVRVPALG